MKTKLNWVYVIVIGLMLIGAQAFVPANVRAEPANQSDLEYGLVEDGTVGEALEVATNTTVDLVTPCRIIDTRIVGGIFSPGERREYYVYGTIDVSSQGGNPFGCPAPRGEPDGVFINIVAAPFVGKGNFGAFPANIAPPLAAVINYNAENNQPIANGVMVETFNLVGPREIEFINRNGFSHLIVDVYGYYD